MIRRRTLPLIFCLVIALAVASLSGVAALRRISNFQPLGFAAIQVAGTNVFEVTKVAAPATGLQVGDQIVVVGEAPVLHAGELARQLRHRPTTYLTVLRGGPPLVIAYRRPPLEIDVPYLILALIGAFSLLIGLFTLLRHRTASSTLFSLWCSVTAALYLLSTHSYTDTLDQIVFLADQAARNVLPALTLHFFLLFPTPAPWLASPGRPGRPGSHRLLPFLYLPGAVLLALNLDLALTGGRLVFGQVSEEAIRWLDRLDLLHIAAGTGLVIALLAQRLARSASWEERRQLQWIAIGVSVGYVPLLLLAALPAALGLATPQLLTAAAVLPLALVPLTFAYAILRYKLWDIEVVARDTISATVTLLLGMIGFGMIYLAIERGVPSTQGTVRSFLSIAAGLVVAGLLVPARHTVSGALERLQYRGSFGKRRALLSFGRELLHERDLGRLSSSLLEQIETGVGVEQVTLYLLQGATLEAIRPDPALPDRFPADRLSGELLEGEVKEIAESGPLFAPSPQADLFDAGYRYAFPLTVRGRAIGVALAGVKPEGIPLNSDDLDLIRHLLDQAALAIENAQLVGQLQRQLAEVESLKCYSEGIFESSPAGIAVLDEGRRVVSANSTFAAIAGAPRESLIGKPIGQVLPIWPLPEQAAAPVEVSYCEVSGQERHLQVSRAAFDDDDNPDHGLGPLSILVVHDVSARAEMERALKEKDRLAALGMLAAGVAHEVNTPITGISSYAQMLLADTPESDPRHGLLKKVEQQTFRAARIVNNLLETARNRQEERTVVAVEPLLAECVDLFADRLVRRHVEVAWDLSPDAGSLAVWAAEGELQQVFSNLVGNAIDAMTGAGRSGGRLTLGLSGDETTVRVVVSDTGPGISEGHLASIFEPFFSTKTNRGGTGLGLAISRSLVESHQGRLSVSSQAGQGACFTVELPRRAGTIAL